MKVHVICDNRTQITWLFITHITSVILSCNANTGERAKTFPLVSGRASGEVSHMKHTFIYSDIITVVVSIICMM